MGVAVFNGVKYNPTTDYAKIVNSLVANSNYDLSKLLTSPEYQQVKAEREAKRLGNWDKYKDSQDTDSYVASLFAKAGKVIGMAPSVSAGDNISSMGGGVVSGAPIINLGVTPTGNTVSSLPEGGASIVNLPDGVFSGDFSSLSGVGETNPMTDIPKGIKSILMVFGGIIALGFVSSMFRGGRH